MTVPVGYCQCGCGGKTKLAADTNRPRGHVKGEPLKFIHTHHARVPLAERFWQKVDQRTEDECWPWIASRGPGGYGQIMIGAYATRKKPRPLPAHRVAWELTHGPIANGLWVLHRCDNPPCVNPGHLFLGTQTDNMRDASTKGRTRGTFTTQRNPNRRLTADQVLEARQLWASGTTVANLARRFDVVYSTMRQAVHGVTWKHLS